MVNHAVSGIFSILSGLEQPVRSMSDEQYSSFLRELENLRKPPGAPKLPLGGKPKGPTDRVVTRYVNNRDVPSCWEDPPQDEEDAEFFLSLRRGKDLDYWLYRVLVNDDVPQWMVDHVRWEKRPSGYLAFFCGETLVSVLSPSEQEGHVTVPRKRISESPDSAGSGASESPSDDSDSLGSSSDEEGTPGTKVPGVRPPATGVAPTLASPGWDEDRQPYLKKLIEYLNKRNHHDSAVVRRLIREGPKERWLYLAMVFQQKPPDRGAFAINFSDDGQTVLLLWKGLLLQDMPIRQLPRGVPGDPRKHKPPSVNRRKKIQRLLDYRAERKAGLPHPRCG